MLQRVLRIFSEMTQIPHCSRETLALRNYLVGFVEKCGYRVESDEAGNVMARADRPEWTVQAHYDMVCIGEAPKIDPVVEEGWMRSNIGSLGADNGIGVAMMRCLAEQGAPVDLLFTNDEEIGLGGAGRLALPIRTDRLLNLDFETAGEVCIGCAGGEDLHVERPLKQVPTEKARWYRLVATAPGGHSGVQIAEEIPNAIVELCAVLAAHPDFEIASLRGGERINAIPRRAEAIVAVSKTLDKHSLPDSIRVEAVEAPPPRHIIRDGFWLVRLLFGFAHGVRAWNADLALPQSSVNLAMVETSRSHIRIALSGRSMDNGDLDRLMAQNVAYWEACGFQTRREGRYPAWRPVRTPFAEAVAQTYEKRVPNVRFTAIHAGLECALISFQPAIKSPLLLLKTTSARHSPSP